MDRVPQEDNFEVGPYSMLLSCSRLGEQVIVSCRNNRKVIGRVKAFDRHLNLLLEDAAENWSEKPRRGGGVRPVVHERFFNKLFLRGDSIIFVVKRPSANLDRS